MTFLVIIGLIALFLGLISRSRPTVKMDNDNAHLFTKSDLRQKTSINREELVSDIEYSYETKNYAEVKRKIYNYFKYYDEDVRTNFILVFSLVELNELNEAEKYAKNVLHNLNDNEYGFYLLGYVRYAQNEIADSIDCMRTAMDNGIPKSYITEIIHDNDYIDRLFSNEIYVNLNEDDDDLPF
jgi:tetratricopeptide (TPR) repeat protein